ncbi:MAG: HlyD family efflux transporter periplasmic adaptor subunit [Coleofasciculaceae cyanobacterium]
MPISVNGRIPTQVNEEDKEQIATSQEANQATDNWSDVTQELVDSLPQIWTRGLLYFLIIFISIALPWAMLFKVDETGTARGRLEPKGTTIRLDAPVSGTVAAINVKEGDSVKAGQSLLELESELVRAELQQQQTKLEGQQNRLNQLELLQNQLAIALNTQRRQNQAQKLEKQAQVEQARQNLESLRNAYNLQEEEKLAQVNQVRQSLEHSQSAYNLATSRLAKVQTLVQRYRKAFEQGVVAEIEVIRQEDLVQERQRLQQQAKSEVEQAKLRLQEQESSYEKTIGQLQADIEQAQLRLKEQESSYQSLIRSGELAVLKSEEQQKNIEAEITTLKAEISQNKSQIKSWQFKLDQRVLEAPVSGTVFQLPIQGEGTVVQTGNMIAEIAPEGTSLVLRAQMATTESGSLEEGMLVKMKFDAYPFQDYGVVEGKLIGVSPTSKVKETNQGQVATYDLEIELNQDCIPKPSECVAFRAGDTATAEVIVHQRRVIDFLIDPFKKLQQGGMKL